MSDDELKNLATDMLKALIALTTNPHLDLGDLCYLIRDRELQGWDGPAVTAWSNAVVAARFAIADAKRLGMTLPIS